MSSILGAPIRIPGQVPDRITTDDLCQFNREVIHAADCAAHEGVVEFHRITDHRDVIRRFADAFERDGDGQLTVTGLTKRLTALEDAATEADNAGATVSHSFRAARIFGMDGRGDRVLDDDELQRIRLRTGGYLVDDLIRGIKAQRDERRAIHELQKEASRQPVWYAGSSIDLNRQRMDDLLNSIVSGQAKLHQRIAFIESFAVSEPATDPKLSEHAQWAAVILREIAENSGKYPAAVISHFHELLSPVQFPNLRDDSVADVNYLRSTLRPRSSARLPRLPEVSRHGQIGPWSVDTRTTARQAD